MQFSTSVVRPLEPGQQQVHAWFNGANFGHLGTWKLEEMKKSEKFGLRVERLRDFACYEKLVKSPRSLGKKTRQFEL